MTDRPTYAPWPAARPIDDSGLSRLQASLAATLEALQGQMLPPTASNFRRVFEHLNGLSHSDRVRDESGEPSPSDSEIEVVQGGSAAMEQEARQLVALISTNQADLQAYGASLANLEERLGVAPQATLLVQAVTTLGLQTARMSERNSVLELQLTASTARIAKLQQSLATVRKEATTDPLTGLANRRAFTARLSRQLTQSAGKDAPPFCLVILDADHFKMFNDTHGHRTGDMVLRLIARTLTDNVKGRDFVARYGGEEFVIILSDVDIATARTVATKICSRLASRRLVKRESNQDIGSITLSAGVAEYLAGDTGPSLIERADAALYEAKRQGRNRVC